MQNLPLTPPSCDQPAAVRVEVYSPDGDRDFGSLDASIYTCPPHRTPLADAVREAGLSPHPVGMAPGVDRRCGSTYVYLTGRYGLARVEAGPPPR